MSFLLLLSWKHHASFIPLVTYNMVNIWQDSYWNVILLIVLVVDVSLVGHAAKLE